MDEGFVGEGNLEEVTDNRVAFRAGWELHGFGFGVFVIGFEFEEDEGEEGEG